jgi:hypothetical protein
VHLDNVGDQTARDGGAHLGLERLTFCTAMGCVAGAASAAGATTPGLILSPRSHPESQAMAASTTIAATAATADLLTA